MKYTIKAHPTEYRGVMFRSRLEARWAAFFDLAEWEWQYEPVDYLDWSPDFYVKFCCGHSDCPPMHELLVEVKPYFSLEQFAGHPCMDHFFSGWGEENFPADSSAAFGINPSVTHWEMAHGAGGGVESVEQWVDDWELLWKKAGNLTQWKPSKKLTSDLSILELTELIERKRQ